eukprot:5298790-Pleurochrysis_carterae.AAC.1
MWKLPRLWKRKRQKLRCRCETAWAGGLVASQHSAQLWPQRAPVAQRNMASRNKRQAHRGG